MWEDAPVEHVEEAAGEWAVDCPLVGLARCPALALALEGGVAVGEGEVAAGERLARRAGGDEAVSRVGAEERDAHKEGKELVHHQHVVGRSEVGLLVLGGHREPPVAVHLDTRLDDKIVELVQIHRVALARERRRRVRAEDGRERLVVGEEHVVHLLLPQREAVEGVERSHLVPNAKPLCVGVGRQARRRRGRAHVEARDLDVRRREHCRLLGELTKQVATHCTHLVRLLHLCNRPVLVDRAPCDALLKLLEIESHVRPVLPFDPLCTNEGILRLGQREAAAQHLPRALVADHRRCALCDVRADALQLLEGTYPRVHRDARLAIAHEVSRR